MGNDTSRKESVSIRFERETVNAVEEVVEESYLYESFAHFVRVATNSHLEEAEGDFRPSE